MNYSVQDMMSINVMMCKYFKFSLSDIDNMELYQYDYYYEELKKAVEQGAKNPLGMI